MRVMAQFMSSANALARAEYTALVEAKARRISKQELAKRLIVLHLIIPSTIQFIANAFRWDDDDQARAAFLGAFNGLFIVGDLVEYMVGWAVGNEGLFDLEIRHPLEFFTDIFKAIDAYGEDDISIEGFFEGIRSLDLALRVGAAKPRDWFETCYLGQRVLSRSGGRDGGGLAVAHRADVRGKIREELGRRRATRRAADRLAVCRRQRVEME